MVLAMGQLHRPNDDVVTPRQVACSGLSVTGRALRGEHDLALAHARLPPRSHTSLASAPVHIAQATTTQLSAAFVGAI